MLLRQAIREMQDDISNDDQRLRVYQHEVRQLQQRESELQRSLKQLEGELDICFSAGKEELARKLIRRKLQQQQRRKQIGTQQHGLQQQTTDTEARLSSNRQLLESMQQKAECLLDTSDANAPEFSPYSMAEHVVQDSDVEVAFLKEQQRRAS